jgi:sugar phosphate isomerase/epimerase
MSLDRRDFIRLAAASAAGVVLGAALPVARCLAKAPAFKISLAEWSLHRALFGKKLDALDFARTASDLGIDAIEYVNQFFKDKAKDRGYLFELKNRAREQGVSSQLIMIDGEGQLGDADEKQRLQAVENHKKWAEAAAYLGCHSIRVNAGSSGSYDEQVKLAADGLRRLSEFTAGLGLNTIVENHGGLSSNGEWLAKVMKTVDHPRCGTLPDFGNFQIRQGEEYDRYKGVQELMPFAKAVSAKTHDFDGEGNEKHTDYRRMMKIVVGAGYRGYVGIEFEGEGIPEIDGIVATKRLLEKVRAEME